MENNEQKTGVIYASITYIAWGLLPIYWKLLHHVTPGEILASRILWSFIFMLFFLFFTKKWTRLRHVLRELRKKPQLAWALVIAATIITCNWFIYIFAVNSDQVVQASLGYYINPLMSVLLGIVVLKERLSTVQVLSFLLAVVGVAILTISYGSFPWIAIGLAVTFALYGLAKKLIPLESSLGLTLETMVIAPLALGYVIYLSFSGSSMFFTYSTTTDLLLVGTGVVTALPLLYFAKGAKRISLSTLGFLQYIAPTIMLLLGIFVYHEPFSSTHFVAFTFIWVALILYYLSFLKKFTIRLKLDNKKRQ